MQSINFETPEQSPDVLDVTVWPRSYIRFNVATPGGAGITLYDQSDRDICQVLIGAANNTSSVLQGTGKRNKKVRKQFQILGL